jgi:DNA-binding NtrC family response regulator
VSGSVLVVDDDPAMLELLRDRLPRSGFEVLLECTAETALARIGREPVDAVVTDVRMSAVDGLVLCERITASHPHVPVVVITAFGNLDTAIAAIRAGAHDFLPKPFEVEELAFRLRRAVQHVRLHQEVKRLREAVEPPDAGALLGESAAMQELRQLIARFAVSEAPVLVTGETGSGKELVARALHVQSARRDGPFVALNCAAVPETLLESELFGHARGAFTDARSARVGLVVRAGGGTLFLDEIGDLPAGLQPKLLRAIEERRVRPLGTPDEVSFDARIVAATNRDLEAAVAEGRFRADLLFRLDVLRIEVPPLHARANDVLVLAQHFVRRCAERSGKRVLGLSRGAAERLTDYAWPGNVRELSNCIERAVALAEREELLVEDLPERVRSPRRVRDAPGQDDHADLAPLEVIERRHIARVLESVGGNKTLAARILGLDRTTLYRKLGR